MQENQPIVTIIIPTYRRNAVLKKVLEGIGFQTFSQEAIEVIIVDDASTIPVTDDIKPEDFSFSLSIIRQPENKGQGAARNAGIKKAKGKYLLFLDDDIIPNEDLLEEHLSSHKSYDNPKIAVVGLVTWDKSLPISSVMYFLENGGPLSAYNSCKSRDRLSSFYAGNLSIEKDFLIQNGTFDESFAEYGWEDSELGYRLMGKGLIVYLNKNACGQHYKIMDNQDMINRQYKCGQTALNFYNKYPDTFPYITDLKGLMVVWKDETGSNVDRVFEKVKKLEKKNTPGFSDNKRIIPELWDEYSRLCIHCFYSGVLSKFKELNTDFNNVLVSCEKGIKAFANMDWQQSAIFFDNAKSIYSEFYPARWYLISSLIKSGNERKSINELKDMIILFPNAIWPVYSLASVLKTTGQIEEAENSFKTVIRETDERIDQKDIKAGAYYHLGQIYKTQGKTKEAKESFKKCITLNPVHNQAIKCIDQLTVNRKP